MTTTTNTTNLYPFFRAARAIIEQRNADYEVMLDACYKDGYAPSHCRHGTYLWRDYDVICPGCEGPSESDLEAALSMAVSRKRHYDAELAKYTDLAVAVVNAGLHVSPGVRLLLAKAVQAAKADLAHLYGELTA